MRTTNNASYHTMQDKIRVGLLCGGRSAEHEVSLQSVRSVHAALKPEKYEAVLIGIDKSGHWHWLDSRDYLQHPSDPKKISLKLDSVLSQASSPFQVLQELHERVDVVFPVLHGTFGEDGTVQGLLKMLDLPFVGAGVLGSAVAMDKDVMKRLFRDAGIPNAEFLAITAAERDKFSFSQITSALGLPVFVKPANLGSSVGICKVRNEEEFHHAVAEAFRYDSKIIIEEAIKGRELECSVLGNDEPIASLPGEIVSRHEFYSYEAKYIDEAGAVLKIPAEVPKAIVTRIQEMAVHAFQVLCCEGMARVDFFLRGEEELLVNEINTIPGFTRISMYPKLWEISGIPYPDLIDRLIALALERAAQERRLQTQAELR